MPPAPVIDTGVDHLASITAAAHAAETAAPASTPYEARPSSYETEQVREFHPRETPTLEAPSPAAAAGAGYAPAEPVKIDWPSDLQQVESDPDKIKSVQEEPVSQQQSAPRPRRVRPQASHASNAEPLVQIETGSETQSSGEKTTV